MKIACVQMTTACDPAQNLAVNCRPRKLTRPPAPVRSLWPCPRPAAFMEKTAPPCRRVSKTKPIVKCAGAQLQNMARKNNAVFAILVGSMILADDKDDIDKGGQSLIMLIAPDGQVQAQYDKIHMFDVSLGKWRTPSHESAAYQAGDRAGDELSLTASPLGLSICYDVRFPTLYRRLAEAGAQVIFVPSAFTKQTGEAHWHILLRARAIETGCFIVAPAQIGRHENGRETYGHSLIVNPLGASIIAEACFDDEVIVAELDMALVDPARRQIPGLQHGASLCLARRRRGARLGRAVIRLCAPHPYN